MSRKMPLLVLNPSNSRVIYTLVRTGVQAIRANIDRKECPYSPDDIEALTTYIVEGDRLCTLISSFYPDIEMPYRLGGIFNDQNPTAKD